MTDFLKCLWHLRYSNIHAWEISLIFICFVAIPDSPLSACPAQCMTTVSDIADYGLCQQSLDIIQDPSTCLMVPAEWNTTVRVGTTIRWTPPALASRGETEVACASIKWRFYTLGHHMPSMVFRLTMAKTGKMPFVVTERTKSHPC